MKTWEYLMLSWDYGNKNKTDADGFAAGYYSIKGSGEFLLETYNALGARGWELVTEGDSFTTFKREKTEYVDYRAFSAGSQDRAERAN